MRAKLTVETETNPNTWTAIDTLDVTVRDATPAGLGRQAREAATLWRTQTATPDAVRVTLATATHRVTAYAGRTPSLADLTPAQQTLMFTAYGHGAALRPDTDPDANLLVDAGLLARANRVHGHVAGRQFTPTGPVTADYAIERHDAPTVHGTRHLPTADTALLDQVADAITDAHPDAMRVTVTATAPGARTPTTVWTSPRPTPTGRTR